jgi:hypothetical protein
MINQHNNWFDMGGMAYNMVMSGRLYSYIERWNAKALVGGQSD